MIGWNDNMDEHPSGHILTNWIVFSYSLCNSSSKSLSILFCSGHYLLFEENMAIPIRSTPSLLLDVFGNLDMNEIEKCQLVSNRWNHLITPHKLITLNFSRHIYKLVVKFNPVKIFMNYINSLFLDDVHCLYSRIEWSKTCNSNCE